MDESVLKETFLSKETVYHGGIIDVQRWQVRLPNGVTAARDVVLHDGAAAVVAVDEMGRVAMVRQYRCPIERVTLELPAGKLNYKGEDPLACAKRELEEETGLRAARWRKLSDTLTSPAFCTERITLFLAQGLTRHSSHLDEDEFLLFSFIPLDELIKDILSGRIQDSKTITGLLMAKEALIND